LLNKVFMKALVTGATGFLGGALARRLHALGWDITALGRSPAALAELERDGIRTLQADLANASAMTDACKGQEIVFHSGALSSPWGRYRDFYQSNLIGTRNIIRGCEEHNVKRLVYVSTPSIYFNLAPRLNVKEDDPLPAHPVNHYAATKLLAERDFDRAHADGLPVIAIRPRAIFGPRDTTILPRLIQRLQAGNMPIIGDGQNIADLTYVENVVDALLLCADSPASILGKKYNITNGEPVHVWDMAVRLSKQLGFEVPTRYIPYPVVDKFAAALELIYHIIPGQPEPPLTRYSVSVLALSATLDISAARRDLGYSPHVSNEEGLQKFVAWWKDKKLNTKDTKETK
jgi:nucleoside-diphosphate-sugar epimerase